jgi:hypothetical protein
MGDVKDDTRLAKVVDVVDSAHARCPLQVVINQGALHGVKVGDRFLVFGNGPHIADPATAPDLGVMELVRGQGEVVHVQDHMATIRRTARRRTRPAKRVIRDSAARTALALSMIPTGVALSVVPDPRYARRPWARRYPAGQSYRGRTVTRNRNTVRLRATRRYRQANLKKP